MGNKGSGCAAPPSEKPLMHYFPFAGRGELARVIAAAAGVDLKEAVPPEERAELCKSFGAVGTGVPLLEHGTMKICQSQAIQNYLSAIGPKFATMPFEARGVDMMWGGNFEDCIQDAAKSGIFGLLFGGDTAGFKKDELKKALEKWFALFESHAPADGFINKQKYPTAADCVSVILYKAAAPWKLCYKHSGFDPSGYSKLKALSDRTAEAAGVKEYLARSLTMGANPFAKKADPAKDLTDNVVTLCPYFKLKDAAKFKEIWQEDYKKFAHKEDCVHYAFCFTEDNSRAHCREAYPSAEKVLQHLADVDVPFKAVLGGPAELERLEVHGPAAELEKLKEALSPLGCLFYVEEWGCRPKQPAMDNDTVCHLYPYFKLKKPDEFKGIWFDAYPDTQANMDAEKSHQYAFSFESTQGIASCRESYGDAEAIQLHLKNVGTPLGDVLNGPSDLLRLELHAPASEIAKLKPTLEPLGCVFYNVEWGFRNAVK